MTPSTELPRKLGLLDSISIVVGTVIMLPESGGQYVYLREAYGPLPAFLCGWSFFLIIQSGSIAAVSVRFATSQRSSGRHAPT